MFYTNEKLDYLHKQSMFNKLKITKEQVCGCFYCMEIFLGEDIENWTDNKRTAVCSFCEIDAVIFEHKEHVIEKNLLKALNKRFFTTNEKDFDFVTVNK